MRTNSPRGDSTVTLPPLGGFPASIGSPNLKNDDRSVLSRGVAFMFIVVVSMPIRIDIRTSIFTSLSILDLSLWGFGLIMFLRSVKNRFYFGQTRLSLALTVPCVVAFASLVWTADTISSVKYVCYMLTCVLMFWVTVNLFRYASPNRIVNAMALFVVLSLIVALLYWSRIPWIWSLFGFKEGALNDWDDFTRASQFARLNHPYLGRSNDYATVVALFSMFFYGLFSITKKYRYLIVFTFSALAVALTLSRGVVLALAIVFLISVSFRRPSRILIVTIVALALLVVPLYYYTYAVEQSGVSIINDRLYETKNIESRFERYEYAWDIIKEAPILGYGGGRYLTASFESVSSAIHDTYLEQVASFGVPLGLLVVAAMIYIPVSLWDWPTRDRHIKIMAKFGAAGIIVYLLASATQTSNEAVMPRVILHFYLGLLVAYLRSVERARWLEINTVPVFQSGRPH